MYHHLPYLYHGILKNLHVSSIRHSGFTRRLATHAAALSPNEATIYYGVRSTSGPFLKGLCLQARHLVVLL